MRQRRRESCERTLLRLRGERCHHCRQPIDRRLTTLAHHDALLPKETLQRLRRRALTRHELYLRAIVRASRHDSVRHVRRLPARRERQLEAKLRMQKARATKIALTRILAEHHAAQQTQIRIAIHLRRGERAGGQLCHTLLGALHAIARIGVRALPLRHTTAAVTESGQRREHIRRFTRVITLRE